MTTTLSDENATAATMGSAERPISNLSPSVRRFCDITNTTHNVKLAFKDENVIPGDKDLLEKLHKENDTILRAIADKEIIEIQSQQIQKLKENLMEITQRNWQLAQTNSQLLAEVNHGKDKCKLERHEFGVTSGMLKARISELKGRVKTMSACANGRFANVKEPESDVSKPHNHNQRRLSRIPSIVPSNTDKSARNRTSTDKRMCVRRRSSNFKREASEVTELVKNTEMIPRPDSLIDDPMQREADSSSTSYSFTEADCQKANLDEGKPEKQEQEEDRFSMGSNKSIERLPPRRRSSIGRPTRSATQKVATYKELPLNIKMRRNEVPVSIRLV